MKICVDFDGTCVTHEYPNIGKEIGTIPVLKELVEEGHQLILFTMRSGVELDQAVQWFTDNEITLYGIQEDPEQSGWTASPKAYGNVYIDDAALGCPLKFDVTYSNRPFVNWEKVKEIFYERGILEDKATVKSKIKNIKNEMQNNLEYTLDWQNTLAMYLLDEGFDSAKANQAAASFLKLLFDYDITKHEDFKKTQKEKEE